jgi:hypothetical protein
MSKYIGKVAACPMPREVLSEANQRGLVTVLASVGGVELTAEPVDLDPEQARYLAGLLCQAADESEAMKNIQLEAPDQSLPEDAKIKAAHPTRTGRNDLYTEAMRLVGAKHSKAALVELVNWLLYELQQDRATMIEAAKKLGGISF